MTFVIFSGVAGRLIAKHVGQSLYTWTSVIGVVLGGITIGNLVGGHVADRFQPRKALCVLYWLAALACFSLPHLDWLVGSEDCFGLSRIEDWRLRIGLHRRVELWGHLLLQRPSLQVRAAARFLQVGDLPRKQICRSHRSSRIISIQP